MERLALPKVRSRETRVTWAPNLRDHGRTVDAPLLRLLVRLQARHGHSWASEGGLRRLVCQDIGHLPGSTTVSKALRRLAAQGLVVQVWLRAGQILPDGSVCTHGTRLVYAPQARRAKRAARRWNARQDRRAGYETRRTTHQARELVAKIAGPPPAPAPVVNDPHASAVERERRRQLAAAAAWMAENEPKPPDK